MESKDRKLASCYIMDILKKYSDEKHFLPYAEISQKIKDEFDVDIDPKTIGKYINLLQEYGVDIVKKRNVGCALIGRTFDNSELSFLIDAVFSSKSISSGHAQDLIKALMNESSVYEKKRYDYVYKADDISRTDNKSFFYTIDTITRAIEDNKQISFTYNEVMTNKKTKTRFNGKEFIINPYFMINNRGKYYLVCNYDKYNTLSHFKIECISNIKVLETTAKPIENLDDTKEFEIGRYVNEHIYMFSGETIQATIKLVNPKTINDVVDWYGNNIQIKEKEDGLYVTFNVNEQAFLYWAMQYGMNIEIIKPVSTKKKYLAMLKDIMNKYDNKSEEE